MTEILKKHETIGCCGIDCGLCPRFYTSGTSTCPGCGGLNFKEKHPSCGFLTCCVKKNGLEVCSDCKDYPCKRFDSEKSGYDSFVTHRKVFVNLEFIKSQGMTQFICQQKDRMNILTDFLNKYDDGRSKSFYCLSCTLLPLDKLQEIHKSIMSFDDSTNIKDKSKRLRAMLKNDADNLNIKIELNKKQSQLQ